MFIRLLYFSICLLLSALSVLLMLISLAGEYFQRRFPPPVPSRATDQATQTGLHHSDTVVDVCAEFQSLTLRVPSHRDAILHLRHHRDAGVNSIHCHYCTITCFYYLASNEESHLFFIIFNY